MTWIVFKYFSNNCVKGTEITTFFLDMLSKKIEKAQWAEKKAQRVVALQKQPKREILCCGSYSEDSEGFGLKVTSNLWERR